MGLSCGIIGLPNAGKSTLFNALAGAGAADAANYPFCTIEPNVADVAVHDPRLKQLATLNASARLLPAKVNFVDIAGLVRGASRGEGLGNRFLGHIREVDALIKVVRCFSDNNITHVEGSVDPMRDLDILDTELVLADLESVERRKPALEKRLRAADKDARDMLDLIDSLRPLLEDGQPARSAKVTNKQADMMATLGLLTTKPVLYVANVAEDEAANAEQSHTFRALQERAKKEKAHVVALAARFEEEVAGLEADEQGDFLEAAGLSEPALPRLVRTAFDLLDLICFFTSGPKETRAWQVKRGAHALKAAGTIHTDFAKGFIRAEVVGFDDYVALGGEVGAKDAGRLRVEGKDYLVQDGDVMHFRFNL